MDNWKLGEEGLFKENEGKSGFSIGGGSEYEGIEHTVATEEPKRNAAGLNRKGKDGGKKLKKILYLILAAASIVSVYYLYETLKPSNNSNISLFGLKTYSYKSNVLPENNLVITGYLVNKNTFPIGYVRLEGKLYTEKKITILSKRVYAGNYTTGEELKKMSNVAVNMMLDNKDGMNMSNVEILPDHPIRFMLVFFDIGRSPKNYSVSVSHFYRITK